jgi:hypothetical protein
VLGVSGRLVDATALAEPLGDEGLFGGFRFGGWAGRHGSVLACEEVGDADAAGEEVVHEAGFKLLKLGFFL